MKKNWIVRTFFVTFAFFIAVWGVSLFSSSSSEEAQRIDAKIQQLGEMKKGYEARALRHETQAEYLQFDQQALLETKRHLELARENRDKAALIQEQIDRLSEQRRKLQ